MMPPLLLCDFGHLSRNTFHSVKLLNLLQEDFYCSNKQALANSHPSLSQASPAGATPLPDTV